jgi:hypothetical protein
MEIFRLIGERELVLLRTPFIYIVFGVFATKLVILIFEIYTILLELSYPIKVIPPFIIGETSALFIKFYIKIVVLVVEFKFNILLFNKPKPNIFALE